MARPSSLLVVVSYYDRRPTSELARLFASMRAFDPGCAVQTAVVANRTSQGALDLSEAAPGAVVLQRENTGMNIGAWEFGWRSLKAGDACLFLQDECFVVRQGWGAAFAGQAARSEVGLLGESLNPSWERPWAELEASLSQEPLPDHWADGAPATRWAAYGAFWRREAVPLGPHGRHLRSLVWCARREVLEAIGGFPIGANYGECIAAEVAVSRRVEALGLEVRQVREEPFHFIRHLEYNRDHPQAPFSHKPLKLNRYRPPIRAAEMVRDSWSEGLVARVRSSASLRAAASTVRAVLARWRERAVLVAGRGVHAAQSLLRALGVRS